MTLTILVLVSLALNAYTVYRLIALQKSVDAQSASSKPSVTPFGAGGGGY